GFPRARRHRGTNRRGAGGAADRGHHRLHRRAFLHLGDEIEAGGRSMGDVVRRGVGSASESDVVVSGLDLTISSGEWLALIGPNGAGKTTILRAIARLIAHEGEISIGGEAIASLSGRELARRVAMVMQEPHMPEGMSVSQYVMLGR